MYTLHRRANIMVSQFKRGGRGGGGRVWEWRRCRVSYVTGASN